MSNTYIYIFTQRAVEIDGQPQQSYRFRNNWEIMPSIRINITLS